MSDLGCSVSFSFHLLHSCYTALQARSSVHLSLHVHWVALLESVVVQQLLDQVHVREHHAAAAVPVVMLEREERKGEES